MDMEDVLVYKWLSVHNVHTLYGGGYFIWPFFQPIKYLKSEQTTQISPKIYCYFMCECHTYNHGEVFCLNKNLLRLSNINYSNMVVE